MFKLIKLAFYALIGYTLYELYQGFSSGGGSERLSRAGGDLERAMQNDAGRMMNMTGTGRGTTETTEGSFGESAPHPVGRGVIS